MRRRSTIKIVAATLATVALAGCASTQSSTTARPAAAKPTQQTDVRPTANPQGSFIDNCDLELSSSVDGPDAFIAGADMTNTGNVGIVVKTRVRWNQVSAPDVLASKTYRIPVGATRTAKFSVPATGDQIDQMQASPSYQNGGGGCKVKVNIVDTYGIVRGGA